MVYQHSFQVFNRYAKEETVKNLLSNLSFNNLKVDKFNVDLKLLK